jgi:hypothetical protein
MEIGHADVRVQQERRAIAMDGKVLRPAQWEQIAVIGRGGMDDFVRLGKTRVTASPSNALAAAIILAIAGPSSVLPSAMMPKSTARNSAAMPWGIEMANKPTPQRHERMRFGRITAGGRVVRVARENRRMLTSGLSFS